MRAAVRLLTSDGGILDPDDYVSDVVDDREQVGMRLPIPPDRSQS